ncbi:chemotaxis protein CheW [Leptothrix discophora]|uniref:Chemotaxis protein CheW n=1 Tax=Leptothrix discophora TaxID=89 RepID=A0ABT9G6P5_LEPDI|nr:chemotaxis protein CheW [Leptothrix discophora]MDP4302153.1 chemotaxis protein CheW [Leptothrix discophora]
MSKRTEAAEDDRSHWGSFTLDGARYAVPLAQLREVVPAGPVAAWPGTDRCVAGAIELRGLMLPVVDLRRLSGPQAAASAPSVAGTVPPAPLVVVIAHDGQLLGLCADAVTGIFRADADRLNLVSHADGSAPAVRGSLQRRDTGEVLSLLDPAALMTLPQVPRCRDPRRIDADEASESDEAGNARVQGPSTHWLLLAVGDWHLAIDSACVRMAVPLAGLRASVLSRMPGNADCLGEWPHPTQPVVVIDPLVRAGLGALREGEARQAVLIDTDGGLLGLAIGAVLDVCRCPAGALQPLPGGRVSRPEWFAGVLNADVPDARRPVVARDDPADRPVLALDAARWTRHAELAGMASLHGERRDREAAPASEAAAAERLTLVTYALPAEAGSAIGQIDEVLPWQADRAGLEDDGRSPWLGIVMHRQHPIVLLCLRRWSGVASGPVEPSSCILVVRSGEHRVGLVVPRLLAIEAASWQGAITGVLRSRNPTPISAARLAQIDDPAGSRRLVPVLDLQDIAGKALAAR